VSESSEHTQFCSCQPPSRSITVHFHVLWSQALLPATYESIRGLYWHFPITSASVQLQRTTALTLQPRPDISKFRNTKRFKNALLNFRRGSRCLQQRCLCSGQLHILLQYHTNLRRPAHAIELVPRSAEHLPRGLQKRSDFNQHLRCGTFPPVTHVNQVCETRFN
jgi:hypothetical protein